MVSLSACTVLVVEKTRRLIYSGGRVFFGMLSVISRVIRYVFSVVLRAVRYVQCYLARYAVYV